VRQALAAFPSFPTLAVALAALEPGISPTRPV